MFYKIMHRESCVAQLSTTGECRVCLEDFMPYDLVLVESDDFDERINNVTNFYYWCASRMLTLDRIYAKEILNSIGASQSVTDRERAQIALSYHCLSLLDVFWVKEENEKIRFEDINLFAHSLSNALVDIALRGHQMTVTNAHLLANDLSTGGLYPKAWVRKEDGFYLYKDGGREAVEPASLPVRAIRYALGLAVAGALYAGLKAAFPGAESESYRLFRFVRYGLVGLWVSAGAPYVFLRLRLAGGR